MWRGRTCRRALSCVWWGREESFDQVSSHRRKSTNSNPRSGRGSRSSRWSKGSDGRLAMAGLPINHVIGAAGLRQSGALRVRPAPTAQTGLSPGARAGPDRRGRTAGAGLQVDEGVAGAAGEDEQRHARMPRTQLPRNLRTTQSTGSAGSMALVAAHSADDGATRQGARSLLRLGKASPGWVRTLTGAACATRLEHAKLRSITIRHRPAALSSQSDA